MGYNSYEEYVAAFPRRRHPSLRETASLAHSFPPRPSPSQPTGPAPREWHQLHPSQPARHHQHPKDQSNRRQGRPRVQQRPTDPMRGQAPFTPPHSVSTLPPGVPPPGIIPPSVNAIDPILSGLPPSYGPSSFHAGSAPLGPPPAYIIPQQGVAPFSGANPHIDFSHPRFGRY